MVLYTYTILFGFAVVFWCLELLEAGQTHTSQSCVAAQLAAGTFLLAIVATFELTLLLLFAYVRALGAHAVGGAGLRSLERLAKATLVSTVAALLAGALLRLVAAGQTSLAAADVGWLQAK